MVEGNMGKFEVRSIYSNLKDNSCLNAYVLLRSESIIATPDPFAKFSFAQGQAMVELGGVC